MKIAILSLCLLITAPFIQEEHLTITDDGKELMTINRKKFQDEMLGKPFVDQEKTAQLIEQLEDKINREPVAAKIGKADEIIPGKPGSKVDVRTFTEELYRYLHATGPSSIQVPTLPAHPRVDSELLATIRTKQIGQYVTYFNKNNQERSHNIRLAAEALDSHVVFPGEVFSFNKVVGKRTMEKGYKKAPVIVKGEVSEGIGGGICQLSSTLFNSVDKAGVKIMERYSHSKRVPYVPEGRDATVSWYGPDFTFKNPYNQPILIRSKVYGGQMIVKVYSSDVINIEPNDVPDASKQLPEEMYQ
ncbi:VanW family protein [Halobacillus sp. GSS1]|uniref:VanW family protein n=1 Tax=Halobacillus sp. GSS1 TaxID=2815919 RepID=UPI001A8E0B76|nr:VanW family protein [Halobacillus sp. GSS1]MBN9654292.1 VanW family protein [Halobacillus sp. GSS1]